jgi:hypothetical protein
MLQQRGEMSADQHAEPVQWVAVLVDRQLHCREQLLHGRNAELIEQTFLAGHVVIKGSLLDSCSGRDLTRGRGRIPFSPEERGRGI